MALYSIYSHPIRLSYKAGLISSAGIVRFIGCIIMVICPLLVAYRTHEFWQKTSMYSEQPVVHFKHAFLYILQLSDGDFLLWSTFPRLNAMVSDNLRVAKVELIEADENRDGIIDKFRIGFTTPLQVQQTVVGAKCLLFFDYQLRLYSRFQMDAMIVAEHAHSHGGSRLEAIGQMKLFQREPLLYRGIDRRYIDPIINASSFLPETYDFARVMRDYFEMRNVSTLFDPVYYDWTSSGRGAADQFELVVQVHVPFEQAIIRWSGFWEMIKWGWIQYLSILIVFYYVIQRLWEFVYRNRLVVTVKHDDLALAGTTGGKFARLTGR